MQSPLAHFPLNEVEGATSVGDSTGSGSTLAVRADGLVGGALTFAQGPAHPPTVPARPCSPRSAPPPACTCEGPHPSVTRSPPATVEATFNTTYLADRPSPSGPTLRDRCRPPHQRLRATHRPVPQPVGHVPRADHHHRGGLRQRAHPHRRGEPDQQRREHTLVLHVDGNSTAGVRPRRTTRSASASTPSRSAAPPRAAYSRGPSPTSRCSGWRSPPPSTTTTTSPTPPASRGSGRTSASTGSCRGSGYQPASPTSTSGRR